jgi:hypothetical protein
MVVLTLLGTTAVFTAATDLSIAGNGRSDLHALSLAEAGVHEVLARLNISSATNQAKITPGVMPSVGNPPNPTWSLRIVNTNAPGTGETRTLTGNFGSSSALPVNTVVRYKREAVEQPISHCNADQGCNNAEVVRYHTSFGYTGAGVATGGAVGRPVVQIESSYSGVDKKLLVEALRGPITVNTNAALRTCRDIVTLQGNSIVRSANGPALQLNSGSIYFQPDQASRVPVGGITYNSPCPPDPFLATFGMPMAALKAQKTLTYNQTGSNQVPPPNTTSEIIWVQGQPNDSAGSWGVDYQIGTADHPVIIVVEGDFELQSNTIVYGFIYVAPNPSSTQPGQNKGHFKIQSNARVYGGVFAEGRIMDVAGNSLIEYRGDVLSRLPGGGPWTTVLWKTL